MRSNSSLYVDAGYLLASAATRKTGTSLRNGIHVDYRPLVEALIQQAQEHAGLPVLRVHWYDSAKDGVPDARQERIGELPKVKLRLGRFGVDGLQKGVDLRIGLDLVAHARHRAADIFFLVSGDDDLTEAVEEAQVHGVQVVVLSVPNAEDRPHGVSRHLVRATDELTVLPPAAIDATVMKVEAPKPAPASVSAPAAPGSTAPTPKQVAALGRPAATGSSSVLAYSSGTGEKARVASGYADPDENVDQIDAVVSRVLDSFLDQRQRRRSGRTRARSAIDPTRHRLSPAVGPL